MSLSNAVAIADILSGIAVVATLILLLIELRANTAAIKQESHLRRAKSINEDVISSASLSDIWAKIKAVDSDYVDSTIEAFEKRYGLSPPESTRWSRHLELILRAYEADFLSGATDIRAHVKQALAYPDMRMCWNGTKQRFHDKFVNYVDSLLESE